MTDRVRGLRTTRGWSQEQLAARWGRSRHTVLRLEQGKLAPELGLLADLVGIFGITLDEFLWPVLRPGQAAEAEQEAGERFHAAALAATEAHRQRYLAGLDHDQALRVIDAVGRLAREAPQDLALLADMLTATADRREGIRHLWPTAPFAPDDLWSSPEEKEES